MAQPNFFLVGTQKTASTWLYRCFLEHPDVFVPATDAIHFFTIQYWRGFDWYHKFYTDYAGQKAIGDTTPSYIRNTYALQRIADYCPEAKIILSARNPVERAFSHYWHEKKKYKISYNFHEVFENYDLYDSWIVPGFYYMHLQRLYEYFPPEQVLVLIFEDLKDDPEAFIQSTFKFLNVDSSFKPSVLYERVNPARAPFTPIDHVVREVRRIPHSIRSLIPQPIRQVHRIFKSSKPTEYERGIQDEVRKELQAIFLPENEKLEKLLGRDLSFWK